MNACEKLQIAKLNLRPGRGRSLATLTEMALRRLRSERKVYENAFIVEEDGASYMFYGIFPTLRQARFWQLRIKTLYGLTSAVVDNKTGIRIY